MDDQSTAEIKIQGEAEKWSPLPGFATDRLAAAKQSGCGRGGARYAIPKESPTPPTPPTSPAASGRARRPAGPVGEQSPGAGSTARRGAHRVHRARRTRQITVSYADDEFDLVQQAARDSGLTPTGYVAEAAVAAARGAPAPARDLLRATLQEMMAARTQVRRFAVNVNQAVAQLHATGEGPPWLSHAVHVTTGAVERLDVVTRDIAGQLARRGRA